MTSCTGSFIMGNDKKKYGLEEIMVPDYARFFTSCREVCVLAGNVSWIFFGSETIKSSMT